MRGEILCIACNEIGRSGRLRAFEKDVIVWIGTGPNGMRRLYPEAPVSNCLQSREYCNFRPAKPGPANHLFVLGVHAAANAKPDGTAESKKKDLGWRAERLQKRRDDNIRVQNDSDHAPGCGLAWRLACRAAEISAFISFMVNWSIPVSLALDQDSRSQAGAKSRSRTCSTYSSAERPYAVALACNACTSASGRLIVRFIGFCSYFYYLSGYRKTPAIIRGATEYSFANTSNSRSCAKKRRSTLEAKDCPSASCRTLPIVSQLCWHGATQPRRFNPTPRRSPPTAVQCCRPWSSTWSR